METLMVVSSENKNKLIFNNSKLDSVKYISFGELRKRMMFSYDVKALYEVIKIEGLSVSNAKIILDNLYFLTNALYVTSSGPSPTTWYTTFLVPPFE